MTALKDRLRAGGTVTVCNTDFPTPGLVAFVGTLGFDAVFIDCEHSPTDFGQVELLAMAARSAGLTSVLRPWSQDAALTGRYLSCGVDGIQIPHVDSVAEAQRVVDGMRVWEGDHERKLFVLMIESLEAIEALPDLLRLDGVDVFYVGSHDLAISMGLKGRARDPRVVERVEHAISTVAASNRVAGMNLQNDLSLLARYRGLGLRWINVHMRVLLAEGAGRFLAAARNG